jgi:hydroxymethylglutaryl-CoA synthase
MSQSFGVEDIRFAFPSLYMDLSDLAIARSIEPAKLQKGLGLYEMGVCDTEEDVVTLAADALIDIIKSNNLTPEEIGRIYVGTESSIDGSKPIASYLLGILTQYFTEKGQLENCCAQSQSLKLS